MYEDLIGKKVCTDQGEDVGVVTSLVEVPQGHLIDVKKTNGKHVLIPFVSVFVDEIDDEKIIIKPIEGLL
jgi:16S rRNA processing protein RimM